MKLITMMMITKMMMMIMAYGCKTNKTNRKLRITDRTMVRAMLGIALRDRKNQL